MSPRDKTRAHMQKLVAVAALAAGCSKKTDPGYGVVDPMPPPAQCPGASGGVAAKATFLGADVLLELDFSRSSGKPVAGASSWDGKVLAEEIVGDLARIRVRPSASAGAPVPTSVNVTVPVACGPQGRVVARLGWTQAPSGPAPADDGGLPPLAKGPPTVDASAGPSSAITVDLRDQ